MPDQNIHISRVPNTDEIDHALGTLTQFVKNTNCGELVIGFDVVLESGKTESWEIEIRKSSSNPLPLPEND